MILFFLTIACADDDRSLPPSQRPIHSTVRRVQYGTLQALIHKPNTPVSSVFLYSTPHPIAAQEECLQSHLSEKSVSVLVHHNDLPEGKEYAQLLIKDGTVETKQLDCS